MWKAFWLGVIMCGLACAADNPFLGTWKRNNATFKFDDGAGGKGYEDHTLIITANGSNGITITEDIIHDQGERLRVTTAAQFDGKDYPWQGSRRVNSTWTFERVNERTLHLTLKDNGKPVGKHEITVAKDGKSLRRVADSTTPTGRKFKSEATFERQ